MAAGRIIDFGPFLRRLSEDFAGREWLFSIIDRFIESDRQVCLLTGEPGCGKSSFIATLALTRPDCIHHFVGKGSFLEHLGTVEWGDATRCAESLGTQLVQRFHQDFVDWERLGIRVNVTAHEPAGEVVGIEVEDYEAMPRPVGKPVLDGDVKAISPAPGATVIAVNVQRLNINPRNVLLYLFLEPLSKAAQQYPDQKLLVAIDGLDEWNYSDCANDVGELLAEQILPSNVKVLLSMRRGHGAERRYRRESALIIDLSAQTDEERKENILADARAYLRKHVAPLIDNGILAGSGLTADLFTNKIAAASAGNFLYLRHFVAELREGFSPSLLQRPPRNLAEIYDYFLDRLTSLMEQQHVLAPFWRVIGVLAVARDALTRKQIIRFAGTPGSDLQTVLHYLQAYLSCDRQERLSIYHRSFATHLTDTGQKHVVDPAEIHGMIAGSYRGDCTSWSITWSETDDYGLAHLATHLSGAADAVGAQHRLPALLKTPSYLEAKAGRFGLAAVLGDFALPSSGDADVQVLGQAVARELVVEPVRQRGRYALSQQLAVRLGLAGASTLERSFFDALSKRHAAALRLSWGTVQPGDQYFRLGIRLSGPAIDMVLLHSTESKMLAVACKNNTVEIWDARTCEQRRVLDHSASVAAVAAAPDGTLWTIASAFESGCATLARWDVASGRKQAEYQIDEEVNAMAASAGGQLAIGTWTGRVGLFDPQTGEVVRWRDTGSRITALAFSADGSHLVSLSLHRKVVRWSGPAMRPIQTARSTYAERFGELAGRSEGLAISSDAHFAIVGGNDYAVRTLNLTTGEQVMELAGLSDSADVILVPRPDVLVVGTADGAIQVCDIQKHRIVREVRAHADDLTALAWDAETETIFSASKDGTVKGWNLLSGLIETQRAAHLAEILNLSGDMSTGQAVSADRQGVIRIWNYASGQIEASRYVSTEEVRNVCPLPDAAHVVVSRLKGPPARLPLHAVETGDNHPAGPNIISLQRIPKRVRTKCAVLFSGRPESLSVSDDGSTAAIALSRREVVLWNVERAEIIANLEVELENELIWLSRDGTALAATLSGGAAQVWFLGSAKRSVILRDSGDVIAPVLTTEGGSRLLVTAKDGTALLWDLEREERIGSIALGVAQACLAAWTSDGSLLAIAGSAGGLELYAPSGSRLTAWASPARISAMRFLDGAGNLLCGDIAGGVYLFQIHRQHATELRAAE